MKVLAKDIIYLDIMMGGRFVRQIPYEYCPLFPIDSDEVKEYVLSGYETSECLFCAFVEK